MASSTAFVLTPSPQSLDPSPALHLLPFSLGSSSVPYTSATAPLSTFFRPRPCPPDIPSIPEGTPIAAFRGRQLVGQVISVPRGYRGVILGTGRRPDRGGVEVRKGLAKLGHCPLTPASSAGSVVEDAGSIGARRSARKARGAGQVALSRPKPRAAPPLVAMKRYRLDLEEEEDIAGKKAEAEVEVEVEVEPRSTVARTPSKRVKITGMMGVSPVKGDGLPAIVVQAPTPHKRARRSELGTASVEDSAAQVEAAPRDEDELCDEGEHVEVEEEARHQEDIVPSPSTENDPPSFDFSPRPIALPSDQPVSAQPRLVKDSAIDEEDYDTSVRALSPTSEFESFTLWTPDAPLAGFRAAELSGAVDAKGEGEEGGSGVRLGQGWWRTGGAGEAGDEIVRAMGEWLGLVEIVGVTLSFRSQAC